MKSMGARILPLEFVSSPVGTAPRLLFLGSYPPRECGIATFTKDVVENYCKQYQTTASVIAIDDVIDQGRTYPKEVVERLDQFDRSSYARIAQEINAHPSDILNIQHEYGLFGGQEGEWVLDILRLVRKPIVLTLHTVLPEPTEFHLKLAQQLISHATTVVVLSETGKTLLSDVYGVSANKISVIHHGVPDVPFQPADNAKSGFGAAGRSVISTFGLISRGKGLEYAIEAMRTVADKHPEALYLILGQTHPSVRRHEGESYRELLQALVEKYGLQNNITLVDRYLEYNELMRYLSATDIYLTPYLNPTQIVSGTLAYAMGAGKAIVSTPYLYAQELLANGRGFLAGFRDSQAIAQTINALLDDSGLRRATERRAYRFGRRMTWSNVALEYGSLFQSLMHRPFAAASALELPREYSLPA
jgi:glycosyltransferase involved in cell wall biosynthesis